MAVEIVTQNGLEGFTEVDLGVEVSGMTITVKAGEAKWCGRDVSLAEDKTYVVDDDPDGRSVMGHLVEEESGGINVLVDEVGQDDTPYYFFGSPYVSVMLLFRCDVPGGASSIEDASMKTYRVVQPPGPEEGDE